MVAPAKTTNAYRSVHCEPKVDAGPAIGADTAAPTTPASEIRLFAFTRLRSGGSRRGTVAARVTPYALEVTRQPSAVGYISTDCDATASAIIHTRKARIAIVAPR